MGDADPIRGNEEEAEQEGDVYFTPIAFPLLASPGALAVILGLGNRHDNWLDFPGFVVGILIVLAIAAELVFHGIADEFALQTSDN